MQKTHGLVLHKKPLAKQERQYDNFWSKGPHERKGKAKCRPNLVPVTLHAANVKGSTAVFWPFCLSYAAHVLGTISLVFSRVGLIASPTISRIAVFDWLNVFIEGGHFARLDLTGLRWLFHRQEGKCLSVSCST